MAENYSLKNDSSLLPDLIFVVWVFFFIRNNNFVLFDVAKKKSDGGRNTSRPVFKKKHSFAFLSSVQLKADRK